MPWGQGRQIQRGFEENNGLNYEIPCGFGTLESPLAVKIMLFATNLTNNIPHISISDSLGTSSI